MNIKLKLFFFSILVSVSSLSFSVDTDTDGVEDNIDNCIFAINADQSDLDNDEIGDLCDADADGDGIRESNRQLGQQIQSKIIGRSLQLSEDGKVLAFAGTIDYQSVSVYDFLDNEWVSRETLPIQVPPVASYFDISIALAENGNTIAVSSASTDSNGYAQGIGDVSGGSSTDRLAIFKWKEIIDVTVAANNNGAGNVYVIDGVQKKDITLRVGTTYIFNYESHKPLRFSTTNDGTWAGGIEYEEGVTKDFYCPEGDECQDQISIKVTSSTPSTLYYYSTTASGAEHLYNAGMGGKITISDSVISNEEWVSDSVVNLPAYWVNRNDRLGSHLSISDDGNQVVISSGGWSPYGRDPESNYFYYCKWDKERDRYSCLNSPLSFAGAVISGDGSMIISQHMTDTHESITLEIFDSEEDLFDQPRRKMIFSDESPPVYSDGFRTLSRNGKILLENIWNLSEEGAQIPALKRIEISDEASEFFSVIEIPLDKAVGDTSMSSNGRIIALSQPWKDPDDLHGRFGTQVTIFEKSGSLFLQRGIPVYSGYWESDKVVALSGDGTSIALGGSTINALNHVRVLSVGSDNCPEDFNPDQTNSDSDGLGDICDTDDDDDGVPDISDAFPLDPEETVDTDSDGTGNNADRDDDDDGIEDENDAYPLISIGDLTDTDSDGRPNDCDSQCLQSGMFADLDDDNDGVPDDWRVVFKNQAILGENVGDNSGYSIDFANNANVIAIGAPLNDKGQTSQSSANNGHIRVYERNGDNWNQIGEDLDGPSSGDRFGYRVSISGDGLVMATSSSWSYQARAFKWNGQEWISRDNNQCCVRGGDYFGDELALSNDASLMVVGATASGSSIATGSVWVYAWDQSNDTWELETSIAGLTTGDAFGSGISLSADNQILAVGGWGANNSTGHVRVFQRVSNGWMQLGDPIAGDPSVTSPYAYSGYKTSLTKDGSSIIVGAMGDVARVYSWNGTQWLQKGDAPSELIARGVNISNDGSLITITDANTTQIYEWKNQTWSKVDSDILGGWEQIAMSDDGKTLAIPDVSDGAGVVKIYSIEKDLYPLNNLYSYDSDGDGMPDAWETRYGLDPNDLSDATSDQDNDGVTALDEFLAGTIPSGSIDLDGNDQYDALTDGLLLLRGMFGLDGSALVTGTIASDATYTESVDIESRIETLGDLADIDGNGDIDALTDGLLTLRYLFGLQGDTLINGVVAVDATRTTAEEIEAHLETLMPAL